MNHNYVQNENFNILTMKVQDGIFILTGESKDAIEVNDTINHIVDKEGRILRIDKITERRDSKDYPSGNELFYKVECTPFMLTV